MAPKLTVGLEVGVAILDMGLEHRPSLAVRVLVPVVFSWRRERPGVLATWFT